MLHMTQDCQHCCIISVIICSLVCVCVHAHVLTGIQDMAGGGVGPDIGGDLP